MAVALNYVERRHYQAPSQAALKLALNDEQRDMLSVLEQVGWSLRFVRRDADRKLIAWVYDPDHQRLAVIEPDGTLRENLPPQTRH